MTTRVLIAQWIGVLAVGVGVLTTQQSNKKNIYLLNGLNNILNMLQYIVLMAYTGCISCIIAILRNLIFSRFKNGKIPFYVLLIYWTIAIAATIPFINSAFSIIPIINIILYGFGIWQKDVKLLKFITFIVGVLETVYNLLVEAYVSIINGLIDLFGGLIAFIRLKIKDRKHTPETILQTE